MVFGSLAAHAGPKFTNVRYKLTRISGSHDMDRDDAAVFQKEGVHFRGGAPFFLHWRNSVLKTQEDASTYDGEPLVLDALTTSVPKAVGVFLLVATTGTQTRELTTIGKAEYQFSDGSVVTGNILTKDHYIILDQPVIEGGEAPEVESPRASFYTTVNGHLARHNLNVIYHSFPEKTLTGVEIIDTQDEGDIGENINAPIWVYGITIATSP
jgi:hypothetical protein